MTPNRGPPSSSTPDVYTASEGKCPRALTSVLTPVQSFSLKLIDLYGCHESLWNVNHPNFLNLSVQKRIWASIAYELDPKGRITVNICRSRIQELRHYDNYLRLQKLRSSESRKSLPYIPLHIGSCYCDGPVMHLSSVGMGRNVSMTGFKFDMERCLKLLPRDCYEHAFDFLNKKLMKNECEDGGRKGRSKGEK